MNTRAQKRKSSGGSERVAVAPAANGIASDARHDVDFVGMAKAQIAARASEHRSRIAAAAYYRAMHRGFQPGHELDDWLAAEAEVADTLLVGECIPTRTFSASSRP